MRMRLAISIVAGSLVSDAGSIVSLCVTVAVGRGVVSGAAVVSARNTAGVESAVPARNTVMMQLDKNWDRFIGLLTKYYGTRDGIDTCGQPS